ncbi:hypothetical protein, partial [Streptomyces sp. NPDC005752]|uniref:hypothetical protein n=1 Tax=Streptomyces sp. NPDC005752 TaxID=3157065 RepID=UPI0034092C40
MVGGTGREVNDWSPLGVTGTGTCGTVPPPLAGCALGLLSRGTTGSQTSHRTPYNGRPPADPTDTGRNTNSST